jgi:hypothetical protein
MFMFGAVGPLTCSDNFHPQMGIISDGTKPCSHRSIELFGHECSSHISYIFTWENHNNHMFDGVVYCILYIYIIFVG